ncbi:MULTISPECIES: hypothetical protein [unclassified Microbacterium]|uniref:hypothetical protein n=1 Tax=unclassified Microbacterium TaxID=2609290 RepID=UPI00214D05BB|nr:MULTISPECIES: hypothetical protein [unclassified Microbacterium]MCR2800779.1 hypothetical protein [Microbacterium sp. zg.Y818]WIM23500.1 hypothetical protein QNO21_05555 [Microbacterium sp. zg-Y818]
MAEGKITARLPEDFLEAFGEENVSTLVATAYTITSRELDTAQKCAFDVVIEYTDPDSFAKGLSFTRTEALNAEGDQVGEFSYTLSADDLAPEAVGGPNASLLHGSLYSGAKFDKPWEVRKTETLDESKPENGWYVTDFQNLTYVSDCAEGAGGGVGPVMSFATWATKEQTDNTNSQPWDYRFASIAAFEVSPAIDGTLTLTWTSDTITHHRGYGDVTWYFRGEDGNWIAG